MLDFLRLKLHVIFLPSVTAWTGDIFLWKRTIWVCGFMCHTFCGWNPTMRQFKWDIIKSTVGLKKKNGSIFCVYRYILIKEKSIKPNEAIWQFFPLNCCLVTLRAVGYYFLLVHPEKRLKRKAKEIGDVGTQATGYHAVFLAFTGCEWSRFQKNPAI